jgi:hypothetical protein
MQCTPISASKHAQQLRNRDHFDDFDESKRRYLPGCDTSTFKRFFFTPINVHNAMHAIFSFETSQQLGNRDYFVDFDESNRHFLPFEILRRSSGLFTPFNVQNVMLDRSTVETSPTA